MSCACPAKTILTVTGTLVLKSGLAQQNRKNSRDGVFLVKVNPNLNTQGFFL